MEEISGSGRVDFQPAKWGEMTQALVRYDAMCRAIEACHSVDEVKQIRDKALALATYAHQAQNTEAERKATEIRLRAERKAGEILIEMKERGERQKPGEYQKSSDTILAPTLSELGISPDQSSKWQQLAVVPDHQFESALRDPATKPSTKGILRNGKPEPQERMDPDALWIWGRLRDFERDRITDRDPEELVEAMTEPMKADICRILPSVRAWLRELQERSTE